MIARIFLIVITAVMMAASGCTTGIQLTEDYGRSRAVYADYNAVTEEAPSPAPAPPMATGNLDRVLVTLSTTTIEKTPLDSQNLSSANSGGIERKIIYTGVFVVGVYDIEKSQKDVIARLKDSGGYIERQTSEALVIRVPAEKFNDFTGLIEKVGRVYSKNIQAEDITEQYYDVELRLKTRKEYLDSLKNLLDQAGKLEEKLAVQREIASVITEIEQLEGRMRVLSSLISFSTITIEFRLISENVSVKPLNLARQFDFLHRLGIEVLLGR